MSNLVDHARRELALCGQTAEDPDYADSIVRAVQEFASYGHSGGSMFMAIEQITALLRFETLSPLTDDPHEWIDRSPESGVPMWQSRRNPAAFSTDGGQSYYLTTEGGNASKPGPVHQSAKTADQKETR